MYKILVADDEQKIREVIREYAEFEGHEVVFVWFLLAENKEY